MACYTKPLRSFSMMITNPKTLLAATIASAIALTASTVTANEQFLLEEVVVTAQKRVEGLQDVPISISAMDGTKIAESGILRMEDVAAFVPNFSVAQAGVGDQIYMRGMGSGVNQGFEQSVGVYVDGVYFGRGDSIRNGFMDLERIEVLRGPQGVLFGKNTIAGALNLTTASPSDSFEAEVRASLTPETGGREVTTVISGPLSETFAARLAYRHTQEDGYLDNVLLDRDEMQRYEDLARLTLQWDPSERLSANLKVQHSKVESKGRLWQIVAEAPVAGFFGSSELDRDVSRNYPDSNKADNSSVTLSVDYELRDHTLSFVSGYSDYSFERQQDGDYSNLSILEMVNLEEDFSQFSQEVRLASAGTNTLDYIVGAYYQTSELDYIELGRLPGFGLDADRDFDSSSKSWAVFGQASWNLTESLRLVSGLRYTQEQKEGNRALSLFTAGTDIGLPDIPSFGLFNHTISDKRTEESLTPVFTLQYDIGDSMVYATATTGFKAGGFDARSNIAKDFEFEDENVISGELGGKFRLLDGQAELNVAVFWMQFDDMQTSTYDGGAGYFVLNAGKATSVGLEIDGRWRMSESLSFSGSLGYLDFQWDEFSGAKCFNSLIHTPTNMDADGSCDMKGRENAYTPEWSAAVSAEHVVSLGADLELRSSVDLAFMDNHYVAADLNPTLEQSAYTKIDARIALSHADDSWELALVGKNLTDKRTVNYGADVSFFGGGAYGVMTEPPRTISLQGRYSF